MELWLLVWIASAALAAFLVPPNKRATGALLGFLFGPLGVVLSVLLVKE